MRVWAIAIVLLLAGCAESSPPLVDETPEETPIEAARAPEELMLFGQQTNQTGGDMVLRVACDAKDNVWAYSIALDAFDTIVDPSDFWGERMIYAATLSAPLGTPTPESFAIGVFVDTAAGASMAGLIQGGTEKAISSSHTIDAFAADAMPTEMAVTVPADQSHLHLVFACQGSGVANYILRVGDLNDYARAADAPDYVEATVASGVENILAYGTEDVALAGMSWSTMGDVTTTYDQALPGGVRIGETVIEWATEEPGWSFVECGHSGYSQHGIWKYDGNMHNGDVFLDGFVMQDPLSIYVYVVEILAFGWATMLHIDAGDEPASFRFEVEHEASAHALSATLCGGLHLGATTHELFGLPAAPTVFASNGLVQPSTIGGWPLDD